MGTLGREITVLKGLSESDNLVSKLDYPMYLSGSLVRHFDDDEYIIHDIDLIVITDNGNIPDKFKEIITEDEYIIHDSGNKILRIINKESGIQFDIYSTTKNSFGAFSLYLDGDKNFNIALRGYTKKKGFKLNQNGLYDSEGNNLSGFEQSSVFNKLGLKFIPQNRREEKFWSLIKEFKL